MRAQVAALQTAVEEGDAETRGAYRHYYLTLKKDLRRFEEAADEIQYGQTQNAPTPQKEENEEVDLLGGEGDAEHTIPQQSEDVDLLDLCVPATPVPDVQLVELTPATETQQTPLPDAELRGEAFDFLSDKPSERDFINIK